MRRLGFWAATLIAGYLLSCGATRRGSTRGQAGSDAGGGFMADGGAPPVYNGAGDAASSNVGEGGAVIVGGRGAFAAGEGGADALAGAAGAPVVETECAPVAPINDTNLSVLAPDISAFVYAKEPGGIIIKLAYDPVGRTLVMLAQDGKMYAVNPFSALPPAATGLPINTPEPYDSLGYEPLAGFTDHRGIAFGPDGALYVLADAGGGAITDFVIRKGELSADRKSRTWSTPVATDGGFARSGTNYDHNFSGITLSPDGKYLFISSGSRTDHGEVRNSLREVPLSSAVFRLPTGMTTLLKHDDASLAPYLYADGTRNTFDMAFNAAGDLIGADNGPDMDLPDELNFLEQGKHYGFPWRFGAVDNPTRDNAYTPTGDKRLHIGLAQAGDYQSDPTFPPVPAGVTFTDPILNLGPDANFERRSRDADVTRAGAAGLAGITGHRSPLGLAFDTTGALCGRYYKQGFMLSYGALLGSALGDAGEDLTLVSLSKDHGAYSMKVDKLVIGIKTPTDSVLIDNRLFTIHLGGSPSLYLFVLPTR